MIPFAGRWAARSAIRSPERRPTGLASYLGGDLLRAAVADALALSTVSLRTNALEALASRLAELAPTERELVHGCWTSMLRRLGGFRRAEAIQALAALAPVAVALGRESDEIQVTRAISEVVDEIAEWWP